MTDIIQLLIEYKELIITLLAAILGFNIQKQEKTQVDCDALIEHLEQKVKELQETNRELAKAYLLLRRTKDGSKDN